MISSLCFCRAILYIVIVFLNVLILQAGFQPNLLGYSLTILPAVCGARQPGTLFECTNGVECVTDRTTCWEPSLAPQIDLTVCQSFDGKHGRQFYLDF